MPRISPTTRGNTTADRVMGHRPEVREASENLKHSLLGPSSTLSPQLKEEVRRTLAQRTGSQFCASLGMPAPSHASRPESLAVAFANMANTSLKESNQRRTPRGTAPCPQQASSIHGDKDPGLLR